MQTLKSEDLETTRISVIIQVHLLTFNQAVTYKYFSEQIWSSALNCHGSNPALRCVPGVRLCNSKGLICRGLSLCHLISLGTLNVPIIVIYIYECGILSRAL